MAIVYIASRQLDLHFAANDGSCALQGRKAYVACWIEQPVDLRAGRISA